MNKTTITYKDFDLDITYTYIPEEPMVMYYPDGSGHPGSPEEFIVDTIRLGEYDITDLLEDKIPEIEDILRSKAENTEP